MENVQSSRAGHEVVVLGVGVHAVSWGSGYVDTE